MNCTNFFHPTSEGSSKNGYDFSTVNKCIKVWKYLDYSTALFATEWKQGCSIYPDSFTNDGHRSQYNLLVFLYVSGKLAIIYILILNKNCTRNFQEYETHDTRKGISV